MFNPETATPDEIARFLISRGYCSTSPQQPAPYGYSIRTAGKAGALHSPRKAWLTARR